MLRPSRVLAGETFIRKLTPIQASKLRDNFAYALYDRVFRWVVDKINQIFKRAGEKNKEHKDAHLPALSILDIPGFSTDQGGFNAFCNNLLNEKLQQVYNSEIIGKRLEMVVEQIKSEVRSTSLNYDSNNMTDCTILLKWKTNDWLHDCHLAYFGWSRVAKEVDWSTIQSFSFFFAAH